MRNYTNENVVLTYKDINIGGSCTIGEATNGKDNTVVQWTI